MYRSGESQDAYDYRTETIYLPKAQFLLESLQEVMGSASYMSFHFEVFGEEEFLEHILGLGQV